MLQLLLLQLKNLQDELIAILPAIWGSPEIIDMHSKILNFLINLGYIGYHRIDDGACFGISMLAIQEINNGRYRQYKSILDKINTMTPEDQLRVVTGWNCDTEQKKDIDIISFLDGVHLYQCADNENDKNNNILLNSLSQIETIPEISSMISTNKLFFQPRILKVFNLLSLYKYIKILFQQLSSEKNDLGYITLSLGSCNHAIALIYDCINNTFKLIDSNKLSQENYIKPTDICDLYNDYIYKFEDLEKLTIEIWSSFACKRNDRVGIHFFEISKAFSDEKKHFIENEFIKNLNPMEINPHSLSNYPIMYYLLKFEDFFQHLIDNYGKYFFEKEINKKFKIKESNQLFFHLSNDFIQTTCGHLVVSELLNSPLNLILQAGFDPDATDELGRSLLHILALSTKLINAKEKNFDEALLIVDTLIKCGINTQIQDNAGNTALHILAESNIKIRNKFLKKIVCADNINIQNNKGNTVLIELAAHSKNLTEEDKSTVKYLLLSGADLSLKNINGDSFSDVLFSENLTLYQELRSELLIPEHQPVLSYFSISIFNRNIKKDIKDLTINSRCAIL